MSVELKRILYVEDEPDIQVVAKLALEMLGGYTLKICSSGADALKQVPDFKPQLILLDVMMPVMDGPSTLRSLRALPEFATTPVIFMTAKVQPGEIAGYKEIGAVDVIPKPFDPMTLSTQVQNIWERCNG